MQGPLVSILIATYNGAQHIEQTIGSCLQQTYQNFEVLIYDDVSTDTTVARIQSLQDDNRITLFIGKKKYGPYGALNFLLDQAKGAYIAIQDHDDIWHPNKIVRQITFLEENKKYIGCGTKTLMYYEGDKKGFEYYLDETNYYTIHPSLVFRNNPTYRYPDGLYMDDARFQKKILCHGQKIIYNIDETLTLHRIKDGATNLSYKRFTRKKETFKTVFSLHPLGYAIKVICFELMRKCLYPILHCLRLGRFIDPIERLPFRLQGYTIVTYDKQQLEAMGF